MTTTVLTTAAVLLIFLLAFALPKRTGVSACRAVAGVAVAVQIVAFVMFIVLSAGDYSPVVLLWIAVAWTVFPVAATVLGLGFSLANPPRVVAMWVIALALFAMSLPFIINEGAFVASSALLMFMASIFALGSHLGGTSTKLESVNG